MNQKGLFLINNNILTKSRQMANFLANQGLNLYLTRYFENVTKIVTHGGAFHADELLAIATFKLFTGMDSVPVERVFKVSEDDLKNPNVFVIDVGGVFSIGNNNYDHHQDANLQASNLLVLGSVCSDPKLLNKLLPFYNRVSDIDRGLRLAEPCEFNNIVRNFNSLFSDSFEIASQFVRSALEALVITAIKAIEAETVWNELETVLGGKVKVEPNGILMPDWKSLAERDGVVLLASPNARGGWQLVSRDSNFLKIPPLPAQTFRHASGFMAVYESKEEALIHAKYFLSVI